MKKRNFLTPAVLSVFCLFAVLTACGGDSSETTDNTGTTETTTTEVAENPNQAMIDAGKGIGEIKHVELETPLNEEMVVRGQNIYDMKCAACHKLDDTRVVGPGWKGVTTRRKPEWIMNFITNVDVMLDQDPESQKMLEECLTRMPNQNISIGDARDILEFMRKNDGVS